MLHCSLLMLIRIPPLSRSEVMEEARAAQAETRLSVVVLKPRKLEHVRPNLRPPAISHLPPPTCHLPLLTSHLPPPTSHLPRAYDAYTVHYL